MDKLKAISYWTEGAHYDLDTAKALLRVKKYPYALFFGHLALEKILKALVVATKGEHAPHTHSLVMIARKAGLKLPDQVMDQLAEYMEFHTEARYPGDKKSLYAKCTRKFAKAKLSEMEALFKCLIEKLKTISENLQTP